MGYYANGNGFVDFGSRLNDVDFQKAKEILSCAFETDGTQDFIDSKTNIVRTVFDIWNNEKYYGDDVEAALADAAAIAPIEDGEICYVGEDNTFWRFIWKDDKWVEENGEVVYESDQPTHQQKQEIYDELSRVLTDYEENKADADELYEMLVKVQNSWENVITAAE